MQAHASVVKSFLLNSASLLGIRFFIPLFYLVITVSLSRILGVREFGLYATLLAYYGIFRMLAVFGIDTYLIRETARREDRAGLLLGNAYFAGAGFSFACMLGMNLLLCSTPGYPASLKLAGFVLSLSLAPAALSRYHDALFIAGEKTAYLLVTVFLRETIKLALALFVLFTYRKLLPVIVVFSASAFLELLLSGYVLNRYLVRPQIRPDAGVLRAMVRESSSLAVIMGISSVFLTLDVLVLSRVRTAYDVGLYSAAFKFVTLAFLVNDSVGTSLLPLLSKAWQRGKADLARLAETTLKYFVVLVLLYIAVVTVFSEQLVRLVFGPTFAPSAALLQVLIWVPLIQGTAYFMSRMLLAAFRQQYDLLALAIACGLAVPLNYFLALAWGPLGTAAATLASYSIFLLLQYGFLLWQVFPLDLFQTFVKPGLAGAVPAVLILLFRTANPFLALALALAAYGAALVLLRIIRREEVRTLASAAGWK